MRHFPLAQWTDFVRGLLPEADRRAMRDHASGCAGCRRTRDLLGRVWTIGRADGRYEAPAYAIRCARAISSLRQPESVQLLPKVLARLVYDSFREPQPAGVRGRQRLSRQALYEAGEYSLDLRLESGTDGRVALIGQIASRRNPARSMKNVPVLLLEDKEIVASSVSNEFGEFHMGYSPRGHLRLYVPVQDGKSIQVALGSIPRRDASRRKVARETRRSRTTGKKP